MASNMHRHTTNAVQIREELRAIAEETYIFGYSLVIADIIREVSTYTSQTEGQNAPAGRFAHYPLPDATVNDVASPNVDTLRSLAFLDLSSEPVVLSVPAMGHRYYVLSLFDAWTDVFASLGPRTTGNREERFAIVGPRWRGALPTGIREVRAPTSSIAIAGRISFGDEADQEIARNIQRQYRLTPLSAWDKAYTPPQTALDPNVDSTTTPAMQVDRMEADTFFARLAALMSKHPPREIDSPMLERMEKLGVVVGQDFDLGKLDPLRLIAGQAGFVTGRGKVIEASKRPRGTMINGWEFPTPVGTYGVDYLQRAGLAATGLGSTLREDCLVARCRLDGTHQSLRGVNAYVLHFSRGETPPARAFWSLSMYNSRNLLVDNPINRYALRSNDPLRFNSDGSLDLYIQHFSPGEGKESNWLPTPWNGFTVVLRLYWAAEEGLDGSWMPPALRRVA